MLNKNRTGLIFGSFFAAFHLIWTVIIAVIPGQFQDFLNWVCSLYSIEPLYTITPFDSVNSFILIILSFIFGYILGVSGSAVWNLFHRLMPRGSEVLAMTAK